MANESPIQPYSPAPQSLGPGIWIWDGEWYNTSFRRRMTLFALKESGGLWIHNPFRMRDTDFAQIENLAKTHISPTATVQGLIAPNAFHGEEATAMKMRWPHARLFAAPGIAEKLSKQTTVEGVLPEAWPAPLARELECFNPDGMRMVYECVFFHVASKTLVLTDLAFNKQTGSNSFERWFFRWNRIDQRLGPSRICKHVFVKDRARFRASIAKIMEWDFTQVIVNHGPVVTQNAKAQFREGFAKMGLL